jgi:hypothetical protein
MRDCGRLSRVRLNRFGRQSLPKFAPPPDDWSAMQNGCRLEPAAVVSGPSARDVINATSARSKEVYTKDLDDRFL